MTLRAFLQHHSFPRFVLVGAAGFLVDAGLLSVLHFMLGIDVISARLLSFSTAVTATWYLNRVITFHRTRTARHFWEWVRYAAVAALGGALNLTIFFALTQGGIRGIFDVMSALVFATACSLSFNYAGSRLLVFTNRERLD